jgi:exodeoxyribonuclease VII large subunit
LPKYPFRIGILTSKSGAALGDIVDSIYNRWPAAELFFYDVPVQGEGAAGKIAAAIRDVNNRNAVLQLDVIIVGRGGGSMEDLWAFNEEAVARAIFNSKIPVISAVGHEVDVTIADLVADARASTPTKAGVIAVPDIKEVLSQINQLGKNLAERLRWIMQLNTQRVDEVSFTLSDYMKDIFSAAKNRLGEFFEKVLRIEPHRIIADEKIALNNAAGRMAERIGKIFSNATMKIETQSGKLSACNPKSVLNRGYSITRLAVSGAIIKSVAEININDIIITELKESHLLESKVIKKAK